MPSKVITSDADKRKQFKEQVSQRVSDVLEAPVEEEKVVDPVDVEIPSNFWELSDPQLFGLLKLQQLTPEQSTQLIEQLRGRTVASREFKVVLSSTVAKEIEAVEERTDEVVTISVELPSNFKTYKNKDQYLFLTKERALPPEHANDIVDILRGAHPREKVQYDVSFSSEEVSF